MPLPYKPLTEQEVLSLLNEAVDVNKNWIGKDIDSMRAMARIQSRLIDGLREKRLENLLSPFFVSWISSNPDCVSVETFQRILELLA